MIQLHYILINFHKENKLYSSILKEIQKLSTLIDLIIDGYILTDYVGVFQQECKEIYHLFSNNSNRRQKLLKVGINLHEIEYIDRKFDR